MLLVSFILLIIFNPENRIIWLSPLFAPLGGLLRHLFGIKLNGKGLLHLPYGTYLANLIASIVLAILTVTKIVLANRNNTEEDISISIAIVENKGMVKMA